MPNLVVIHSVVLEMKIFFIYQCIVAFLLSSPIGKGQRSSFVQTGTPSTKAGFFPSFVWHWLVVLEKIFIFRQSSFFLLRLWLSHRIILSLASFMAMHYGIFSGWNLQYTKTTLETHVHLLGWFVVRCNIEGVSLYETLKIIWLIFHKFKP